MHFAIRTNLEYIRLEIRMEIKQNEQEKNSSFLSQFRFRFLYGRIENEYGENFEAKQNDGLSVPEMN